MPRLTLRPPKYRRHKASGQAVVTLNGRDIYLGRWDSFESKEAYRRLVGEWQTARHQSRSCSLRQSPCVAELILGCLEHAEIYYRKHGKPTSSIHSVRSAMRVLDANHGTTIAEEFRPLALKQVRRRGRLAS